MSDAETPGQRALLGRVLSLTEAAEARAGRSDATPKLPLGEDPAETSTEGEERPREVRGGAGAGRTPASTPRREEAASTATLARLPGSGGVPHIDVRSLSDDALATLTESLRQEFHRRALDALDPGALVAEGYEVGFDSRGAAKPPYLRGSMLVCPGAIVAKSASSHECSFAHIGEKWVWESELLIHDDVTKLATGGREHQRSVSLVVAENGLAVDVITSKMTMGVHHMKQVRSFEIRDGELVLVSTRAPRTGGYGAGR